MQYELSICIPTYNREKYLKDALDSIVNQLDGGNRDKVEICVSDNASQDNTKELVESYRAKHTHITYFCWDKNMGADNNYLKVVEIAHGKYCWLLGSDDILLKDAVSAILQITKENDCEIFFANEITYDIDLKKPSEQFYVKNTKKDHIYTDYKEMSNNIAIHLGYISRIIVKKEKWDAYADDKKFVGSAYQHTYICFQIIKAGGRLYNISKPLIGYRTSNDSFLGNGNFHRIEIDIKGYYTITKYVFGENSTELTNINRLNIKYNVFHHILIAVLYNAADIKYRTGVFDLCFKYYKLYPAFWLKVFPLLLTPSFILKFIRFVYRKTLKKTHYIKDA